MSFKFTGFDLFDPNEMRLSQNQNAIYEQRLKEMQVEELLKAQEQARMMEASQLQAPYMTQTPYQQTVPGASVDDVMQQVQPTPEQLQAIQAQVPRNAASGYEEELTQNQMKSNFQALPENIGRDTQQTAMREELTTPKLGAPQNYGSYLADEKLAAAKEAKDQKELRFVELGFQPFITKLDKVKDASSALEAMAARAERQGKLNDNQYLLAYAEQLRNTDVEGIVKTGKVAEQWGPIEKRDGVNGKEEGQYNLTTGEWKKKSSNKPSSLFGTDSPEIISTLAEKLLRGQITIADLSKRGGQLGNVVNEAEKLRLERGIPEINYTGDRSLTKAAASTLTKNMAQESALASFAENLTGNVQKLRDIKEEVLRVDTRLLNLPISAWKKTVQGTPSEAKVAMLLTEISTEAAKIAGGAQQSIAEPSSSAREKWESIHDPKMSIDNIIDVAEFTDKLAQQRLQTVRKQLSRYDTKVTSGIRPGTAKPKTVPKDAVFLKGKMDKRTGHGIYQFKNKYYDAVTGGVLN